MAKCATYIAALNKRLMEKRFLRYDPFQSLSHVHVIESTMINFLPLKFILLYNLWCSHPLNSDLMVKVLRNNWSVNIRLLALIKNINKTNNYYITHCATIQLCFQVSMTAVGNLGGTERGCCLQKLKQ